MIWHCRRFSFDLKRPLIMGVLNVTPDSFSDGGQYQHIDFAVNHAKSMIASGVDIIDIGAESSRPGAPPVSEAEELQRLLPIVEALLPLNIALSVDTYKARVMREVLALGADIINDITGFKSTENIEAVQQSDCGLCIMHMQGEPSTMQSSPQYDDVIQTLNLFFETRVHELTQQGISAQRLCIDPGIGFGKNLSHNLAILQAIPRLKSFALPILIGLSRKSMLGELTGRSVNERLAGSLAGGLACLHLGANIIRVHDVAESVDALKVWQKIIA